MTTNTAEGKTSSIVGGYDVALRARKSSPAPWADVTNNDNTSAWLGQVDVALRERTSSVAVHSIGAPAGRRLDKMALVGGQWTATALADYMHATTTTAWILGANMLPTPVAGDYTLVSDNAQTMAIGAPYYTAANASVLLPGVAGKPAWAIYNTGTATAPASWTYLPLLRVNQLYPGS